MAAVPLDRHHGMRPSPNGKVEGSRSFARSTYTTSSSLANLAVRPVASTSTITTPHSPGIASTSSSSPRQEPWSTPDRHERRGEGATAIGEADGDNQSRPIGRARSEVNLRSRSRRQLVDPGTNSNVRALATPSASPATRMRSPTKSHGPDTPGFLTEHGESPASFVTARSFPAGTPPPRPTRSPHRDVSPSALLPRSKSSTAPSTQPKTTLIQGTEFEIISALPAHNQTSTHEVTLPATNSSPMTSFTFPTHARSPPDVSSSTATSSRRPNLPNHSANGSVFRLERPPHAFPESYLAVRDSLSQTQIDQFTLSLAARFPAAWTTSDTDSASTSSSSALSSPTKARAGPTATFIGTGEGNDAGGRAGETEDWARQRRMSSLISGLGMVLGSSSFGTGALLMQEEDEEEEDERNADAEGAKFSDAPHQAIGDEESVRGRPPTSNPAPERTSSPLKESTRRRSRIASAINATTRDQASTRTAPFADSRTQSSPDELALPFHLDFDPVTFASLTSGSISLPPMPNSDSTRSLASHRSVKKGVAVEYGYATGGADGEAVAVSALDDVTGSRIVTSDDGDDDDGTTTQSIKQLVRQSWRLSSSGAGSRDFKPLSPSSPKRRTPTTRPTSQQPRFDDGLGITLELLDFEDSSRAVPSSYTPSSRPVLPRGPSLDQLPQTNAAPVMTTTRPLDLPTSPPLVAEPPTPSLTMTPAFSPASEPESPFAFGVQPHAANSDNVRSERSADLEAKRHSVLGASPHPQPPRTSSLAAPNALSSSTTTTTLRRRSSNDDGMGTTRRRSVLGASKSSKRISALFSSGIDKVRARTSSHNSKDADDEREKEDGRTARRRALTDGLISAPISSPSPALSASTSSASMPRPAEFSSVSPSSFQSSTNNLPPPSTPSAPLTQSPFHGRTWRSKLSVEQFEDLARDLGSIEMRRQEVIWELCETERSFVNGLRGVIQVFTLPLRTRDGTWIKGVPVPVSRLLDWLDDIVYLHSQIFDALDQVRVGGGQHHPPVVARIADAFLPYVPRLEVHQPYLVRFETVTRQIDEMAADQTSDFGEFVRMQSSLPECGALSLSSFLLKPVQRLMKYPLFFRQLCDLTPPNHPDHLSTLSLLHSTDSIIRVMQEVKTREDEYEETKLLESRISGLPNGFKLARRDRRLVAHGVLKRVHISDKDRSLLEMDAIARAGLDKPNLRGNAPISPGLSPVIDASARPRSTISESSSSSLSVGSLTYASDHSSGWNSPTTPGAAFQSPTRLDFAAEARGGTVSSPFPSPLLRPDSMVSNSSSIASESSNKGGGVSASAFDTNLATRRPAPRRVVKTKAKESTVYVFVFSDLVVLAAKPATPSTAFGSRSRRGGMQDASYRAIEAVGLSRVLGVSDLSGKTEHEHLIEVDLLPIREGQDQAPLSLSNTSLASSIYLTLPPASSSRSPLPPTASFECQVKERIRWLQAFERTYLFALRSLSFPSLLASYAAQPVTAAPMSATGAPTASGGGDERLSCASYLDAGIVPKSPSLQYLEKLGRGENGETTEDGAELEREERGWWAVRLKQVRREMESAGSNPLTTCTTVERRGFAVSMAARGASGAANTPPWPHPSSSQTTASSGTRQHFPESTSARRPRGGGSGGGARPGQVVTYSAGQVVPVRRPIQA